jgi:hypothetical protein
MFSYHEAKQKTHAFLYPAGNLLLVSAVLRSG